MTPRTHLWEVEHPYRGPRCPITELATLDALIEVVDGVDADMNVVIRFDWYRWDDPIHDTRFQPGDDRAGEEFWVYVLRPGLADDPLVALTCPVSATDEDVVLEWLRSDRVLGPLKDMWFPLLGQHEYETD